jgi:hypothetical protein
MPAVPLIAAAAELGMSVPGLRRAIRAGAPVARRGRRGRGNSCLVDPAAIVAWRGSAVTEEAKQLIARGTACESLPDVLADALFQIWQSRAFDALGLKPWQAARLLAYCWHDCAHTVRDHLQLEAPLTVPEKINALRQF